MLSFRSTKAATSPIKCRVTVKDKNIEVSNPGAFVANNSLYKFIGKNNPERRNPWLYQRLLTLIPNESFVKSGMGMPGIRKAFKEIGEVKFLNIGSQNLFKAVLPYNG